MKRQKRQKGYFRCYSQQRQKRKQEKKEREVVYFVTELDRGKTDGLLLNIYHRVNLR